MATAQFLIYRKRPHETRIQNSIIWDRNLSNMARFTLIAILSLPDDWDYSVRGLAAILGVSKDTMGKYLRELEDAGYLRRQQGDDKGKFSKSIYTITDTPGEFGDEDEPCPKNYDSACPNFSAPKKSPQKNVRSFSNNNPPKAPRGGKREKNAPKWKPDAFERWWSYYRRHARGENRAAAIKAWDKLQPDDALIRTMGMALMEQVKSDDWQRGIGIPYGSTWLNNRRWEDTPKRDSGESEEDGPLQVEDRGTPVWT